MSISKIGGTGTDYWELISSVTPTAASASVNFTGLSTYRKLLLIWDDTTLAASGSVSVRLNNDSSSNYLYTSVDWVATPTYANSLAIFATSIGFSTTGTNPQGFVEFGNCDSTGLKSIVNAANSGATATNAIRNQFTGYYKGSSIVSQVNLITDNTFNAAGTVYLYGVK